MAPVLLGLLCAGGFLLGLLAFAVFIFQVACRWCRLKKPGFFLSAVVVVVSWVVLVVIETVMIAGLQDLYRAAGQPPWEARFVGFFLALPIQLAVSAVLHVGLLRVRLGKAIEVWFIQWLIVYSLFLGVVGLLAVAVLAAKT